MFTKSTFVKAILLVLLVAMAIPAAASEAKSKGDAVAGKATYDLMCVSCHGSAGKGDGVAAAALDPKPRDLSDGKFLSSIDDAYITKIVNEGGVAVGKSEMMPALGMAMTPEQLVDLVAFVRTLPSPAE